MTGKPAAEAVKLLKKAQRKAVLRKKAKGEVHTAILCASAG